MPITAPATPASAAPVDRLSLSAQWARPTASDVGPSVNATFCSNAWCFADSE